jgi:hypothetical protein
MRVGAAAVALLLVCSAPAGAQTRIALGVNFTSTIKSESHVRTEMPDANGAAGPDHVIEFINGDVKFYDKKGKLLRAQTTQEFWDATMDVAKYGPNPDNRDPRLLWDPHARRWYASAQRPASAGAIITVARSNTADPTKGWQGFSLNVYDERPEGGSVDFDRLGFDASGVHLTINQLAVDPASKRLSLLGVALIAFKKSDLLKDPLVVTMAKRERFTDARNLVPVIDLDGKSKAATLWGSSRERSTENDLFARVDLVGDHAAWKLEPTVTIVGGKPGALLQRMPFPPPMTVPQPDGPPVGTGFSQPTVAYRSNGDFWMAHTAAHPDDKSRTAIRWWRIRASDSSVVGEGVIKHAELSMFMPSLAIDGKGRLLIVCAGTSTTQPLSVYAIAGTISDDKVSFDPEFTLVKAGTGSVASHGRWGDYFTTFADPARAGTFWAFTVYAAGTQWATQITEITVK